MKPPVPKDEIERLAALRRARLLDTLPEPVFDDYVRLASRIAGTPIALVTLVDEKRQWFKAKVGIEGQETARDDAFCAHAIVEPQTTLVVPDAMEDPRFRDNPLVVGSPNVRFYAGAPLVDEQGHAFGALCVIDRVPRELPDDVREELERLARLVMSHIELRRRALEAVETQTHAEATAERLRITSELLDLAPDMIFVKDRDHRIVMWNRGAESTYGWSRAEALGKNANALLHTKFPAPLADIERALFDQGHWEGELAHTTRSGRTVVVESRWVLRRDEQGVPQAILELNHDVTTRREVERMKDEFVSVVSHELRTPLTAIRGALGLIEGGVVGDPTPEMLEMVSIARTNADRLIRLVNDILDLEKMEAGKLELNRRELAVGPLVARVLRDLAPIAERAKVTLIADVPRAATIAADEDRMVQLLTNLVSNAVKFSPEGTEVTIRATRGPRTVRFAVIDRGPGIPPNQIGKLFGKFQQLDASDVRTRGGTGLGLAICKAIAEQHGGAVGVESTPGKGSTFFADIPLRSGSSARHPTLVATRLALLVDPRGVLTDRLGRLLTQEGCLFKRAQDLDEAEAWLDGAQPNIIIVDLDLDHDAHVLERLTQRFDHDVAPTIVITGHKPGIETASLLPLQWLPDPLDETRLRQLLRWGARDPGPPRVLIVEDDLQFRAIMAARLRSLGVEVSEAESGNEAVAAIRREPPDLIVLDIGLPDLDGFDVVQALRGDKRALPLLVYTARDLDSEDRRSLTLGLTRWLTKSRTTEEQFLASVRELLDGLLA